MTTNPSPLLLAKLTPPAFPLARLVPRHDMLEAFSALPRKRLALIVAGAGFGKTSLVAQAVHTMGMNCVWYSLDPSDQDWGLFFSYLAHGLSRISEGFDRDLLQHPLSSLSRQQREKLLTAMLLQLQGGADSHLAIVLDDFHLVHENKDITESLEFLLPRLPGHVHLIICSRELPCLSLSRYRASRQILDIGEAELAFTRSEIHEFYKRAGTPAPAPETVDSLHERTGGWAAALVLSLSSLSFGREAGGALHPFPGGGASTNALHQYIEENFFLSQPEDLKEFMLKTSLLSWLDPEVCDMLPGVGNSLEHLESLSQRHLLTFPMASPEASFRYHHLLREFLQQRLRRTSPPEDIRSLHLVIGDIFEQRGYRQAAMEHYLEARAHDRTCALFSSMVLSDLAEFPFQLFIRAVNSIPADVMRDNPRMLHIKARIAALRGDLHSALRDTRLALELLRTREDTLGIVNCLKDMSFLNYLKGEVRLAHEEMLTLWRTQGMDPWFYGEIGGYLVFFASLLGRFEEAESFHEAALARLTHSQDPRAMVGRAWIGLCHCVRLQLQGDFQACEILAQKSLDELKSLGFDVALPIAYVHAAINSLYLREPEELARRADLGLELAERLGIQDHQYGWLLYVKAASCLDNNDISRAMRLGHQAMEIFQAMENSWGHSTILKLMALIRIARGDLVGAEDSLRKALDLVQGGDMPVWQGILLMELVLLLLLRDDYDQAAALLETNEPIFKSSWFTLCMFWLLRARVLRWQGLPQRAAEEEARAMPLVERYGYRNWVRDFFRPLDEVCSAPSQGTHQTGAAQHPAPPLRINCLGSFLVHVGERAIPPQAWRNSKATRIFQYLALNSHKGFVPKDFLLELIWPEEDPALTAKRFHVALHFLRKLLEPELERGQHSSYLLRHGDAYRLEIGDQGLVDALAFANAVEQARHAERADAPGAPQAFVRAESLYLGELLPEEGYEQWIMDHRTGLRSKYLGTLDRLIELLEGQRQWRDCILFAEKFLTLEEYAEPAYRSLMRCHAALGDMSGVCCAYQRCEERIVRELGYPLSASTLELHQNLTG